MCIFGLNLVSTKDVEETFALFLSVHLQMKAAGCSEISCPLFNYKRHTRGDCVTNYHRPENMTSDLI